MSSNCRYENNILASQNVLLGAKFSLPDAKSKSVLISLKLLSLRRAVNRGGVNCYKRFVRLHTDNGHQNQDVS